MILDQYVPIKLDCHEQAILLFVLLPRLTVRVAKDKSHAPATWLTPSQVLSQALIVSNSVS